MCASMKARSASEKRPEAAFCDRRARFCFGPQNAFDGSVVQSDAVALEQTVDGGRSVEADELHESVDLPVAQEQAPLAQGHARIGAVHDFSGDVETEHLDGAIHLVLEELDPGVILGRLLPGLHNEADGHFSIGRDPFVAKIREDMPEHRQDRVGKGHRNPLSRDEARCGRNGEMHPRDDGDFPAAEIGSAVEFDALEAACRIDEIAAGERGLRTARGRAEDFGDQWGAEVIELGQPCPVVPEDALSQISDDLSGAKAHPFQLCELVSSEKSEPRL